MGIPHLITHLRPFSCKTDLSGQDVVIDGPALAYHIYYLCLASQPRARNPFEATPSPALLRETVLRWLEELQAKNVTLYGSIHDDYGPKLIKRSKRIIFDGCLPSSKQETRLSRLATYTRQLSTYHQSWPQLIPNSYPSTESSSSQTLVKLFDSAPVPLNLPKLSATPFLVPSILEALLCNKNYQSITEVVPGEADSYCAQYVRRSGGTVLTGDSDLLVHGLGNGTVTFLRDIEIVESSKGKSLGGDQYNIADMAERLGLPSANGIRSLAFEMYMEPHGSFVQLLQQATQSKAITLHKEIFKDFSKEYASLPENSDRKEMATSSLLSQKLRMLDPRISEYVLQFPMFAQAANMPEAAISCDEQEIHMFLPFLLDCPIRTSAWEMSTPIRQFAYSLVNQVLPPDNRINVIVEYRKLQSGTKGRGFQLPSVEELSEACTGILDLVAKLRKLFPSSKEPEIWRAVAFHQECIFAIGRDQESLVGSIMPRTVPFRMTWDGIHFFAQLQGSYYSFRMLQQILDLVLCCGVQGLPMILQTLQRELQSLPLLKSMPNPVDGIRQFGSSEDAATWSIIRKSLGVEQITSTSMRPKKGASKKKRKLEVTLKDSGSPQKKVTNIFEHLTTEP